MAKSFTLRISDPSGGTRVLPYDGMYLKYLKPGHCGGVTNQVEYTIKVIDFKIVVI